MTVCNANDDMCVRCEAKPVTWDKGHPDYCDDCWTPEGEAKRGWVVFSGKVKDLATADFSTGWRGPGNYQLSAEGSVQEVRCGFVCDLIAAMSANPGAEVRFMDGLNHRSSKEQCLAAAKVNGSELAAAFIETLEGRIEALGVQVDKLSEEYWERFGDDEDGGFEREWAEADARAHQKRLRERRKLLIQLKKDALARFEAGMGQS